MCPLVVGAESAALHFAFVRPCAISCCRPLLNYGVQPFDRSSSPLLFINGWMTLIPAIEEISSIVRLHAISGIPRLRTARGAPTCWSIKYRPLIREQLSAPERCCPEPPQPAVTLPQEHLRQSVGGRGKPTCRQHTFFADRQFTPPSRRPSAPAGVKRKGLWCCLNTPTSQVPSLTHSVAGMHACQVLPPFVRS